MSSVSVVIPWAGRRSVEAAVESAASQTVMPHEIWVVADGDVDRALTKRIESSGAHVIRQEGRQHGGGGAGRRLGTEIATGEFVAYLDDDDIWLPEKLETQLEYMDHGVRAVSSRVVLVAEPAVAGRDSIAGMIARGTAAPKRLYDGSDVGDWLLRRRRLSVARNMLHTSTLLVEAGLAREHNWNPALSRHQDWDFVIGLGHALRRGEFVQAPEVLTVVAVGSPQSVSSRDGWSESLAWLESLAEGRLSPGATADFYVGQVGRYALQARSLDGLVAALRGCRSYGRPSVSACLLAAGGALPRRRFVELMTNSGSSRWRGRLPRAVETRGGATAPRP